MSRGKALVSLTSSNDTEDIERGPRSASGVMEIILVSTRKVKWSLGLPIRITSANHLLHQDVQLRGTMTDGTSIICHAIPSQISLMDLTRLHIWLSDKRLRIAPRIAYYHSSQGAECCGTTFSAQPAGCEYG